MKVKLIDIEKEVMDRVVKPWKVQVEEARKQIMLAYTPYMGRDLTYLEVQDLIRTVVAILDKLYVDPGMDMIAMDGLRRAHEWGITDIAKDMNVDASTLPEQPLSKNSIRAVEGMAERAQDSIRQAKDTLADTDEVKGLEDMLVTIAPLTKNVTRMEQAVTWSTNNASNSVKSKIALKSGETMTWVSERDGCVHCTAYAGVDATKVGWPKGLTFGMKPLKYKGTLAHPPLHPNCRCDIAVGLSEEYKIALKREAVRSILRGTKLPSESERVRLQAAERLLDKGTSAPDSVEKYARNAIRRGSFTPKKRK